MSDYSEAAPAVAEAIKRGKAKPAGRLPVPAAQPPATQAAVETERPRDMERINKETGEVTMEAIASIPHTVGAVSTGTVSSTALAKIQPLADTDLMTTTAPGDLLVKRIALIQGSSPESKSGQYKAGTFVLQGVDINLGTNGFNFVVLSRQSLAVLWPKQGTAGRPIWSRPVRAVNVGNRMQYQITDPTPLPISLDGAMPDPKKVSDKQRPLLKVGATYAPSVFLEWDDHQPPLASITHEFVVAPYSPAAGMFPGNVGILSFKGTCARHGEALTDLMLGYEMATKLAARTAVFSVQSVLRQGDGNEWHEMLPTRRSESVAPEHRESVGIAGAILRSMQAEIRAVADAE